MNPVWLVIWLAPEVLRHGCQVVGSPGSGKSVLLKAFRGTLAENIRAKPQLDLHLVDFDAKGDLRDLHRAFPDWCPVFDLNPFVHADVFDVMDEIDDPRDIAEIVALMIDKRANETQKFFPESARIVLRKLITRHYLVCPRATTFADIILSGSELDNVRLVAGSHPISKGALALVNQTEAGMSVAATLISEVSKFENVAALYQTNKKGRQVSTKSLLKQRFAVLRLPYDDKSVETLAPLTRLFVSRLQQRRLAEGRKNGLTILLFDELALIPDGLDLSLTAIKGREVGLCPVLAYQSPTMAKAAFTEAKFNSVTSTLKTFVCLNLPAREDAEWAAKRFGDYQAFMRTYSGSSSSSVGQGGSSSSGWSESFQTLDAVTASMIQALPVPTPGNPMIEGFMATIPFKPFRFRISIPDLVKRFYPKVPPAPPLAPRDPKDFVLQPWMTATDFPRLKLP